ncbi:MAG: hypothetical protein U1F43_34850 [Myxococcota bacterium]
MTSSSNPTDTSKKTGAADAPTPRSVKIQCQRVRDGILPVFITVMPTADLDVKNGVFVDVRLEPAADLGAAATVTAKTVSVSGLVAVAANDATGPSMKVAAPGAAAGNGSGKKATVKSHRVAPARRLLRGKEETFETEISLPAPDVSGRAWIVRGRFGTGDGNDLRSSWQRVK